MSLIERSLEAGVLSLALNRPKKLNALSPAMVDELDQALGEAEAAEVRVVAITGRGTSFCSGADVSESLALSDRAAARRFLERLGSVLDRISRLEKPVVAGFQGHAAGGGAEIVLEADLRIAASDAQLWLPDVGIGSTPVSLWRLERMVGYSRAAEMALLGTRLEAEELERLGVVGEVVPPGELANAVAELAARLRDRSGPTPLRHAKRSLQIAAEADRRSDIERNLEAMLACYYGEDQAQAVSRFAQADAGRDTA
jgi:enoyl-CoA hydratase/carnithine racemase